MNLFMNIIYTYLLYSILLCLTCRYIYYLHTVGFIMVEMLPDCAYVHMQSLIYHVDNSIRI